MPSSGGGWTIGSIAGKPLTCYRPERSDIGIRCSYYHWILRCKAGSIKPEYILQGAMKTIVHDPHYDA
jgi:hypothetical protein